MVLRNGSALIVSLALFSGSFASKPAVAPAAYKLTARWAVGGEGGWDYLKVDAMHRLFLSRGTHTMVVDTTTGKVIGDIPDTAGVHGIAFAAGKNLGFTSNGRDNTVTEFNMTTLQVIKKIPVSGQNPDCIIYEPKTKQVLTFNGRSGDVSAIDPIAGKETGKFTIGGKLEFAASDPEGHVFVNNESTSEVVEFDAASLKLIKKWSIAPGEGPSGIAIDAKHHHLFSVTDGKMMVSDTELGKVIATVPIGDGPDATAYDPKLGLAFSSNGESATLSVVKAGSGSEFSVQQTIPTEPGARTMALDASTHKVYLVTAKAQPAPAGTDRHGRTMEPNSFVVLVYSLSHD